MTGRPAPATNGVPDERCVVFDDVSKFYGEVLGVNRVRLRLAPGITSLVGPNGAGKSTLMNLMAGLVRPTAGTVRVLGLPPDDPERLFQLMGYCAQYDAFPAGDTGLSFVRRYLEVGGAHGPTAEALARRALARVGLEHAVDRPLAGYSKGMRQRAKLAQAIAAEPPVLLLDEPLNGLDPLARAEIIDLFRRLAEGGLHLIISSHILHEVDMLSDRVVILDHGYVVAEGTIQDVRADIEARPLQIVVRAEAAAVLAQRMLGEDHVTQVRFDADRRGVLVGTRDAGRLYALLQRVVVEEGIEVTRVAPADDDAQAVYEYLVTGREDTA